MSTLLAIDTATDALSLALLRNGELRSVHRRMPRQQQQQLFPCLDELLDGENVADQGLDAIVFGCGPGSFTGLRIASSAAQGLAFALDIPVIGVSTLETQLRTWLRHQQSARREAGSEIEDCVVLSVIDARIGQTYHASYLVQGGVPRLLAPPRIEAPGTLELSPTLRDHAALPFFAVGTGLDSSWAPADATMTLTERFPEVLPEARDMLAPAQALLASGKATAAETAVPDYVQQKVGWKTLAEQGRRP